MKPNGGEPVRVPTTNVPVRAIFSSVVSAAAGAAPVARSARIRTTAAACRAHVHMVVPPSTLSVGEDLGQEYSGPLAPGLREEAVGRGLLHDAALVHED